MSEGTVVTHDHPVLGSHGVVRVTVDPRWDPVRYEDLTVVVLDDGRKIVSCVPLLATNVNLGDVIETVEDPSTGRSEYGRRVDRGQAWVFRIIPNDEAAFRLAHDLIHEFRGAVESWWKITAVAIRGDEAAGAFAERLQRLQDAGVLDWETAEQ